MASSRIRRWDDYFVNGNDGVLRNLRGITDAEELAVFEAIASANRMAQLAADPVERNFDYPHMREVHRRIFQDVYEWAGQPRIGPPSPQKMSKSGLDVRGGPDVPPGPGERVYFYYPGDYVEEGLLGEFAKLAKENLLVDRDPESFVTELAERWAEINVLHPFREGNTRTQFVFFRQLAENAGYRLDSELFKVGGPLREDFINARFFAHIQNASWMKTVLSKAIEPLDGVQASISGVLDPGPNGFTSGSSASQGRQAAGKPEGGQFTGKPQSEPEISL